MSAERRVQTIPRCEVEKHRAECPLELVTCEFVDVGCDVKTTRQDLKRHMEESQQQHLLTATLLNLKLTRKSIAEKDRQLAEKDKLIERLTAEKVEYIAEKDRQIFQRGDQLAEKDKIIDKKDKQLLKLQTELEKYRKEFMESTKVTLDRFLGMQAHHFLLQDFSIHQIIGPEGDWFSDPFYSHTGGYHLKLNVETNQNGPFMKIRLYPEESMNILDWPVTFVVNLELLNQLGDHDHYSKEMEIKLASSQVHYSSPHEYVLFTTLVKKAKYVQYLRGDCLKLRMWIRVK